MRKVICLLDLLESDFVMLLFEVLDGIAFFSNIGFDFSFKFVWNIIAGAFYGFGVGWGVKIVVRIVRDRERDLAERRNVWF